MHSFEEQRIVDLIRGRGPCTGLEIQKELAMASLPMWKTCRLSRELQVRPMGQRYLRLDRHVDGFARLSPSILREFLTYSVIGLARDASLLEKRCRQVIGRIREISRYKFDLARGLVAEVMVEFQEEVADSPPLCFIIAGDIVYGMAHDVPRPEHSTGRLVRGSDIDLIVIVDDLFSDSQIALLDGIIYRKKYRMLINPTLNEEIDYKVKRLSVAEKQADFDDFRHMVAIKILHEGVLLHGSENLFQAVKTILRERGLHEKLQVMKERAALFRENAERELLAGHLGVEDIKKRHLFYSAEEHEEFA